MQTTLVVLIVGACVAWLGIMVYRYVRLKDEGKGCGGGCCSGIKAREEAGTGAKRTQMIAAEDLRNRVKARG